MKTKATGHKSRSRGTNADLAVLRKLNSRTENQFDLQAPKDTQVANTMPSDLGEGSYLTKA